MIKRYYDKKRNRLLYVTQSASPEFWDSHWNEHIAQIYANPPNHRFAVWFTRKYLAAGSAVLEGGCGMGDKVYALHKAGFKAKGVDYASSTVAMANQHWPHLDISLGDVRSLPFPDGSFDGYWSLGVIEHFISGYTAIANEMRRVIRPGGYLFLTFPMMNTVRRIKAAKGAYPNIEDVEDKKIEKYFYQYALDPNEVIEKFRSLGFTVIHRGGQASCDCLASEINWLERVDLILHRLPFLLRTKIGVIIDMALGRFLGHAALLIFRKTKQVQS